MSASYDQGPATRPSPRADAKDLTGPLPGGDLHACKVVEAVDKIFAPVMVDASLPASTRFWFIRLKPPVMRIALEHASFFETPVHPARALLNHLILYVSGTRADQQDMAQNQVKNMVEVIERFPEQGEGMYHLLLKEFLVFLREQQHSGYSGRQALEPISPIYQRETLIIHYTLEMRERLKGIDLAWDVKSFFWKVWSEVLAAAAARYGVRHEETLQLRHTCDALLDLVQRSPAERHALLKVSPELLGRLQRGLELIGLSQQSQERCRSLFAGS